MQVVKHARAGSTLALKPKSKISPASQKMDTREQYRVSKKGCPPFKLASMELKDPELYM